MKKITTLLTLSIIIVAMLASCAQTNQSEATSATTAGNSEVMQAQESDAEEMSSDVKTEKITFETTDIKGNTVTEEVFKNYDLTMINVWGTGCVPCIEEMPGLAKFHDSLDDNVNMLTICVDYEADPKFAEDILTQSNANFTTLKPNDSLFESVLGKAQALPTTIFVDSEGNIVGDVILGAPNVETDEEVVEHYTNYVSERLGEISEA